MLDFIQIIIFTRDIVVKRFWRISKYILLYRPNQPVVIFALLRINSLFIDLSQEIMNVHALIDIEYHCFPLVIRQVINLDFFDFRHGVYIFFVLCRFKGSFYIDSVEIFFFALSVLVVFVYGLLVDICGQVYQVH